MTDSHQVILGLIHGWWTCSSNVSTMVQHVLQFGFNLKYVAYFLSARLAMLALQLSISPNLPRLIFKLSWDIIFSIGLLAFMIHIIIHIS